jgi:hypothetical protein
LVQHRLTVEVLVAQLGIVDQILIVGNDCPRVLQHLSQVLRERRVLVGRRSSVDRQRNDR